MKLRLHSLGLGCMFWLSVISIIFPFFNIQNTNISVYQLITAIGGTQTSVLSENAFLSTFQGNMSAFIVIVLVLSIPIIEGLIVGCTKGQVSGILGALFSIFDLVITVGMAVLLIFTISSFNEFMQGEDILLKPVLYNFIYLAILFICTLAMSFFVIISQKKKADRVRQKRKVQEEYMDQDIIYDEESRRTVRYDGTESAETVGYDDIEMQKTEEYDGIETQKTEEYDNIETEETVGYDAIETEKINSYEETAELEEAYVKDMVSRDTKVFDTTEINSEIEAEAERIRQAEIEAAERARQAEMEAEAERIRQAEIQAEKERARRAEIEKQLQKERVQKAEAMGFHGAIKGVKGMYAGGAIVLKRLQEICIKYSERGLSVTDHSNGRGEICYIYYVDAYEEYCVTMKSEHTLTLESGQPLGKNRTYYLPRGSKIFIDRGVCIFELM